MHNNTWQTQEAKAHFSAVLRAAQIKPQWITYRGKDEYVILPKKAYQLLQSPKSKEAGGSFWQFLQNSPLRGKNIKIDRDKTPMDDPW